MIVQKKVILMQNENKHVAELMVDTNVIRLNSEFGDFIQHGKFYYLMLKEIRKELEKFGVFILVNGSRIDVHPSGMSLTSIRAYSHIIGRQSKLEDLVNIFDDCLNLNLIATVDEQEAYRHNWRESFAKK